MTRMTPFSNPLMLGFESMEKTIERLGKSVEGYPPYNIERLTSEDGVHSLRIILAVAGFSSEELDVTVEDNQLIIRGRQVEETPREYLYRGIAARQFQRMFVLAEGMRVVSAEFKNGLLSIDIDKPEPNKSVKRIAISVHDE